MRLLGHKNIANTLIYTQLVEFEDDDKYRTAVANNVLDARKLLETGFEYVCSHKDEMPENSTGRLSQNCCAHKAYNVRKTKNTLCD
jgi:hypothetical protein